MGMEMRMSLGLYQHLVMDIGPIQWSMVTAYENQGFGIPPYVEPTLEEEEFEPVIKLAYGQIPGFESMSHVERMRAADQANEVFHFAYATDRGGRGETLHYRVPLLRDYNANPEKIRRRISKADFERAEAIIEAAGEMERIARAVPYYGLYTTVTTHLRKTFGVELSDVVLVAVDRGGRIPCTILMHAFGLASMHSLKVDQGGSGIDTDRMNEFVKNRTLDGKHVLFVDSTVDSGRQINALVPYFENAEWKKRLGFRSWSVVGSNENGKNLSHHRNINWGVDPDETFEDRPEFMGIDYAPGTRTKVIDCPSKTSEAIRKCLLAVPAGVILTCDYEKQVKKQRAKWRARQKERRAEHKKQVAEGRAEHRDAVVRNRRERAKATAEEKFERRLERIVSSKRWQDLVAQSSVLPVEDFSAAVQNGTEHALHNVLVVGRGTCDLPEHAAQFLADNLGSHFSFFAGTPSGNPGAVLQAVLANSRVATPEVRLYQPGSGAGSFGGIPITYVSSKDEMRRQMIADSHVVLALGGMEGTLREALLALDAYKPTIFIRGYGPVAAYILGTKSLAARSNCIAVASLREAAEKILSISAVV